MGLRVFQLWKQQVVTVFNNVSEILRRRQQGERNPACYEISSQRQWFLAGGQNTSLPSTDVQSMLVAFRQQGIFWYFLGSTTSCFDPNHHILRWRSECSLSSIIRHSELKVFCHYTTIRSHMSDDFYLLCGWKELSIIIVPYLVYTFLVLLGCGPKNRISFTCVLTELPFVETFVRAIVWGEARAGCFPQWNGCAEVFRKACAIAIILVCNHILKESDLKPSFQTTFWKKGVWNLGFGPHFGRKGSETQVLDHILEERGLKPRFWTTFWKKGVWNLGFGPHFGRKGSETEVLDHILEERGLKPRLQTTFWKKGVWNLGFGQQFWKKGVWNLEERCLKPRFWTTFWKKGIWNLGIDHIFWHPGALYLKKKIFATFFGQIKGGAL